MPSTTFPTAGGLALTGTWLPPAPGRPAFVFLHGYPGQNLNDAVAVAMHRHGIGSLRFRYRGVVDAPGEYSFAGLRDDVRAAVAHARGLAGGPVGILGYSMGGNLAVQMVAEDPSLARLLVLLAPVTDLPRLRALWEAVHPGAFAAFIRSGKGVLRGNAEARLREAEQVMARPQAVDLAPSLRMPVLVVAARRDTEVPADLVRAFAARLPPGHRFLEVDTGHDLSAAAPQVAEAVAALVGAG